MKDIHTHEKGVSFQLRMMRGYLRCMETIHFGKAKQTTINLFCRPQVTKIKQIHEDFYLSGKTTNVYSGGYDVKVWTKGKGPVVFVCHGWNSKGANMRHLIEKMLDKGFKVIVPDLPCHERSGGKYVNQVQMSLVLKDLLTYFNGIQKLDYLVTHSWGETATLLAMDEELINIALSVDKKLHEVFPLGFKKVFEFIIRMMILSR